MDNPWSKSKDLRRTKPIVPFNIVLYQCQIQFALSTFRDDFFCSNISRPTYLSSFEAPEYFILIQNVLAGLRHTGVSRYGAKHRFLPTPQWVTWDCIKWKAKRELPLSLSSLPVQLEVEMGQIYFCMKSSRFGLGFNTALPYDRLWLLRRAETLLSGPN